MKKYVLAIDVGKGKSKIGFFGLDTEKMTTEKILKPKDFGHSIADLESLLGMIRNVQRNQIGVMMESTYVYQNPIIEFFKRKGFEEITLVNPLKIKKTCGDIQKVKTDRIDCARIASYYYFSQWTKPFEVSSEHREARELARYLDSIREELNAIRNRIRQHLTNVFPELEKIGDEKSNIFSSGFLNILEKMPHPLSLRKKTEKGIVSLMAGKGKKHHAYEYYASAILSAAKKSLFSAPEDGIESRAIIPSLARNLRMLDSELEEGEKMLESMTKDQPLFKVFESFGGIGPRTASHLTAEIWSTDQYSTPQKLIASTGINPSRSQSAASIDRYGSIVKAGNRYVRHWLFIAINCMIQQYGRGGGEKRIAEYYKKKHSDEKAHHYVATIACANKLLRQVFYRSRDLNKSGELITK